VKYGARVVIAQALYATGLLQLWQSVVMRRKAVVLMYHRVLSDDEQRETASHPGMVVSRETFAAHLRLLKRRFVVLSLEQFADHMNRGIPFPDSSCLITFDDGWRDNLTNALPLLKDHDFPAVIFLPVNYIGQRKLFRREALTHLLVRATAAVTHEPGLRAALTDLLTPAGLAGILDLTATDARPAIIRALGADPLRSPAIDVLIENLSSALGVRVVELNTPDRFMDWAEIEQMTDHQVAFGGHGADHKLLTEATPGEVDAELRCSKAMMATRFRGMTPAFSYPNGHWSTKVAHQVRDCGFRLAFTTESGTVSSGDDRFSVKRLNIHEDMTGTAPMFLARLVGLF
jgi:peptidoglycan/xylan/chitin deacetylase (PgdA/CDA1 family)